MVIYKVYVDGVCVKKYQHRIQAVIFLMLKGFGRRVRIEEIDYGHF